MSASEAYFSASMADKLKILNIQILQKEKQIVVDPMSLKEFSFRQASSETSLPPVTGPSEATLLQPPPLPSPKLKFLSLSLPNSVNSSPRFSSALSKNKWKGESLESATTRENILMQLGKSKSCGEGRACAPSDDFDLSWFTKKNAVGHDNYRYHGSFSRTEAMKESPKIEKEAVDNEGFKCSALCMYLPRFGKGKAMKEKKEESVMEGIISRTVSLEKFECGSWSSSAIIREIEVAESDNSYFDLPLELIKCSGDEAHSPVTAAFVFEKDTKGVLKNRGNGRKWDASPRHVRFSESSSTAHPASPAACLRKAREEFNGFLEAAQTR